MINNTDTDEEADPTDAIEVGLEDALKAR